MAHLGRASRDRFYYSSFSNAKRGGLPFLQRRARADYETTRISTGFTRRGSRETAKPKKTKRKAGK